MDLPQFPPVLIDAAARLVDLLRERSLRVVFAESCTGGLIAASLSRIPGVSAHLCGSAVVYQEATKTTWLQISESLLSDPVVGAVSKETAEAMVLSVMRTTPQADWAASVTGHLGPNAPTELDGVAFVGIARRDRTSGSLEIVSVQRVELDATSPEPRATDQLELRLQRQLRAAVFVLLGLTQAILSTA